MTEVPMRFSLLLALTFAKEIEPSQELPCPDGVAECPGVEVEAPPDPTPIPVSWDDPPVTVPDEPSSGDSGNDDPDEPTPIPMTCQQWVEGQSEIGGYAQWYRYPASMSELSMALYAVDVEWGDVPGSCDALDLEVWMTKTGDQDEGFFIECDYAVVKTPRKSTPDQLVIMLEGCVMAYRSGGL